MSEKKFYNVWYIKDSRWTNARSQDANNPKKLSFEEANEWLTLYCSPTGFEVREITCQAATSNDPSMSLPNNYICITCKNDRLNKTEKSCWSCGEKISP